MTGYDAVLDVAADNHGYVTVADAVAAGIDPVVLRKLVAAGRIERTAQGVYRVPILASGPRAPFAEAVAWARGRGVISHESALDLLELCDVNPPLVHLTVPRGYAPRRVGGERYRVWRRDLDSADVIRYHGIPVVHPRAALRECLAYGTDTQLLVQACETARLEGYLSKDQLQSLDELVQIRSGSTRRGDDGQ